MDLDLIKCIHSTIKTKLPGKEAQLIMSPSERKTSGQIYPKNSGRDSSVLILLYPRNGEVYIPFILRPKYNGAHSGQISLPGGKTEVYDTSLEHTALRETHEEIGVPNNQIKILGALTPTYIPNSNFNVFPFVGYCENEPKFIADATEVDKIIEAPLKQILNPNSIETFEKEINGHSITAPYFNIDNYRIWGATAMIISELKELILKSECKLIN